MLKWEQVGLKYVVREEQIRGNLPAEEYRPGRGISSERANHLFIAYLPQAKTCLRPNDVICENMAKGVNVVNTQKLI